jgi:hypothetical protein
MIIGAMTYALQSHQKQDKINIVQKIAVLYLSW